MKNGMIISLKASASFSPSAPAATGCAKLLEKLVSPMLKIEPALVD